MEGNLGTGEAKDYLKRAIAQIIEKDRYLLRVGVNERCISARLAMYLRDVLQADHPEYDVDVEYNRHGRDTKHLHDLLWARNCPRNRDDDGGQRVLPDVIVHQRENNDANLLIIEMKKSPNRYGLESDRLRIKAFRDQLRYNFGARLVSRICG